MALAKFIFGYKRGWTDYIKFKTLITEFESGKEQRRSKGLPRRVFKLEFEKSPILNDEANQMYQFFVARKGKFEPFLWDYPKSDGTTEEVTVRFDIDNLNRNRFIDKLYKFGLTLIEVI